MTRKRWKEIALVLLILVPLMVVIWLPVLTSEVKPWDAGDPIPTESPSEERRIHNEAGFSIISPPNWTARNDNGLIRMTPHQVIAGRSRAGIVVARLNGPPEDLSGFSDAEFLGNPARLKIEYRPSTFDDPALSTWTYLFQENGTWFEASYFVAEAHDEIPDTAKQYLETLNISAVK